MVQFQGHGLSANLLQYGQHQSLHEEAVQGQVRQVHIQGLQGVQAHADGHGQYYGLVF